MKTALELVAEERQRQIEVEGWTPEHDDNENPNGELALAAATYAIPHNFYGGDHPFQGFDREELFFWPWRRNSWKPTPDDRIRELVKVCALGLAEIERLQRKEAGGNE